MSKRPFAYQTTKDMYNSYLSPAGEDPSPMGTAASSPADEAYYILSSSNQCPGLRVAGALATLSAL